MKLYLIRHGEAVDANVDPQRPLSAQGRKDVEKVANFLKKGEVHVEEYLHSNKKRAQETAEIIQGIVNPEGKLVSKDCLCPEDSIGPMLEELENRKEDLVIVSHLPFLPKLISKLTMGDENRFVIGLDTSSIVSLCRKPTQEWEIVWFVSPYLI